MAHFSQAIPASYRAPAESSRFAQGLISLSQRPMPLPLIENRTSIQTKSRFVRLPHEPEDARITGVTRSLHRRLLALNLRGSLRPKRMRLSTSMA
jgi:hypothetical protein